MHQIPTTHPLQVKRGCSFVISSRYVSKYTTSLYYLAMASFSAANYLNDLAVNTDTKDVLIVFGKMLKVLI